jgi:hypothetical protein
MKKAWIAQNYPHLAMKKNDDAVAAADVSQNVEEEAT